ncbi:MAG: SAM-dependent methyltransferase [Mariprofundaceae bacterium]
MSENSQKVTEILRHRIAARNGAMAFDAFMETALYEPGLGYYEDAQVFGKAGDYVTAVSMGPWLALGLADLIAWGWQQLGRPGDWRLLEQGGGDGRLLLDVLRSLEMLGVSRPSSIIAVERSHSMRQRQKRAFELAGLHDVMQITELADIEKHDCTLAYCNELPDAFPVRCFDWKNKRMYERGVSWSGSGFVWQTANEPLVDEPPLAASLKQKWSEGYGSEWNPGLDGWQRELASVMGQGYVFCVDYGYSQSEYYMPERRQGSLMAHCGHEVQSDVLANPGACDITAHVDFTAMAEAGARHGLHAIHFMNQGVWLAQSPSVQRRMQDFVAKPEAHLDALTAAKRLLLPAGMGEVFKLCVQARHEGEAKIDYLRNFERVQTLGIQGQHRSYAKP